MNSLKTTNILLLVLAFLLAFHEAMGWWRPVGRYVTMSDREALLILDTTTGDVYVRKAGTEDLL